MGLHTAFVGPARPLVYGLLTRKDVCAENAEACLGAKAAAARRAARGGGGRGSVVEEEGEKVAAPALPAVAELNSSAARASNEEKGAGATPRGSAG